jgi:4-hydroxy-4-methyl-2-oxoglutarate aldolase
MPEPVLSEQELGALRELDTCMVSNAVETFEVRLRNTGFANSSIRSMFEDFPPMVGYAATAQLRSLDPPVVKRGMRDRTDWWKSILDIPMPRIVVLEDMDDVPGRGAFIGDVHSAILQSLGCIGVITNGAVRELPRVREMKFHLFAGNVAVSHSYAHIFNVTAVVKVGGLEVHPGDLLHGDRHGVLKVPREIAAEIPAVAEKLRDKENRLIAMCQGGGLQPEQLEEIIKILE